MVYQTVPVVKVVDRHVPVREEVVIERHIYDIVEIPVEIQIDGELEATA